MTVVLWKLDPWPSGRLPATTNTLCRAGLALLLVLLVARCGDNGTGSAAHPASQPGPGEAVIRYLYHSGWAVRTENHLLIFDYIEPPTESSGRTLDNGFVDPSRIAREKVIVFVSHSHGDHHDRRILEWRDTIEAIRYVWGWEEGGSDGDFRFGSDRGTITMGSMTVLNVHHEFDEIPESAFLVRVDGLTIIHAGDHDHPDGLKNPVFENNVRYLAGQAPQLDLFFTPDFGGAIDAIRVLRPRAVFPMHQGSREQLHSVLADAISALDQDVPTGLAGRPGDSFIYSGGRITPRSQGP